MKKPRGANSGLLLFPLGKHAVVVDGIVRLPARASNGIRAVAKCSEYGLLSLISLDSQGVVACTVRFRQSGSIFNEARKGGFEALPICAVNAHDVRKEIGANTAEHQITEVIQRERPCLRFIQHIPSLSPKEHLDMDLYQKAQAREDQRDRDEKQWRQREMVLVGIIIPVTLLAAQVLTSYLTTRMQVDATIRAAMMASQQAGATKPPISN